VHDGDDTSEPDATWSEGRALPSAGVATAPDAQVVLDPIQGDAYSLEDWLTTFPLVLVILDPYTHQSSWILDTAARVLANFRGADCRVGWLVTADKDGARQFLGPLANEFLTFADPDRNLVRALGLQSLPAFVALRQDGSVLGAAEGWAPDAWREVAQALVELTSWSRPNIPAPGDPNPYPGTPALAD
jgi:hypothetical protein